MIAWIRRALAQVVSILVWLTPARKYLRPTPCDKCQGSGLQGPDKKPYACDQCDGTGQIPGKLKAFGDPWSSLGPNTQNLAVTTGSTIPAYYKRTNIELSLDTAVASGVVYILLNPGTGSGQNGTPSATNFHAVLYGNQPPFTTQYSGAIGLVASTGTIHVGVVEN